ncbi:unnamed protein product, partial [Laminaria digitata]
LGRRTRLAHRTRRGRRYASLPLRRDAILHSGWLTAQAFSTRNELYLISSFSLANFSLANSETEKAGRERGISPTSPASTGTLYVLRWHY